MPAPDLFGIKDYVRLLTAPAGMEPVHVDGMSWAKTGLTYAESTKLTADEWNSIIGNLRGLLIASGLDINTMDPTSPQLLRDVVLALIAVKAAELLPGVVLANAAAVAEHVAVPAGSTAILDTHQAAGHLSAYFRGLLAAADAATARTTLGVDAAIAAAITNLVNASPAALDTLAELATALGNDPNFATTITNALAGKVPTTRSIGVSGLATGGGNMSADRTITVTKSSNAQAIAGTDDTTAMTPVRVMDAINSRRGSGTKVATTSGTAFDFTGIPSWAKKITVMFDGVSLSGTDDILVQAGSGAIETTGYSSVSATSSGSVSTSGFVARSSVATKTQCGQLVIELLDAATNRCTSAHTVGDPDGGTVSSGGGVKSFSGAIDRIRVTRTGSNTFDGGQVNIKWE